MRALLTSRGLQYVGLLVVAALALGLSYVALTRSGSVAEVAQDPGVAATPTTPVQPTGDADVSLPKVKDQRRVDFTQGDDLPDGSQVVDSGANESGLAVTESGLTHGSAKAAEAGSGFVEVRLKSDVRSLGVRVDFPGETSGSVALVGWQSSYAAAADADEPAPPTGLRLVASPGEWSLSVVAEQDVEVASGSYAVIDGPVEFQVVRDGDTVYVLDPSGEITTGTSPDIERLAGPWASWGLVEQSADETPAVIESLWAG